MARTATKRYTPITGTPTPLHDAPHGAKAHTFTPKGLRMTGILHTQDGLPRLVNAYGSTLLPADATVWVH
jgi:hypothetical protein